MDTLLQVAASWILPALFFWFLFSIIAMTIIELLQRFTKSREKGLEEVIKKLIGYDLKEDFYKHTLVNPLQDTKPSYMSPSLFAKVIMDWILPKKIAQTSDEMADKNVISEDIQNNIKSLASKNPEFGDVLLASVVQASMKTAKVSELLSAIQKDLETWFLEAVNQMSPVYAARLQAITLVVSLLVAVAANFDVIDITVRLWETSKYDELLALAEKTGQTVQIDTNLITMLPVGWYCSYLPSTLIQWVLKDVGLCLGGFLIAVGSQYVYNLSKKQYRPSK